MLKSKIFFLTAVFVAETSVSFSQIDPNLAFQYFQEAKTISEIDAGKLWGGPIYGPIILADPKTREIVANQTDSAGLLQTKHNVFTGTLPKELNIANTAFDWAGHRWTMLIWPLPEDEYERAQLMMHELFHRIQDDIGFPMANPSIDHLDEKEARILLQLEWQALAQAINSPAGEGIRHIRSALVFRKQREHIYPQADSLETALELNEGLAEYTGVKLSGRDDDAVKAYLNQKVENAANFSTFVRSFAYISGPLYGYLLDEGGTSWRKIISSNHNFSKLLATAYGVEIPEHVQEEAEVLSANYNGAAITAREETRAKKQAAKIAALREKFVEGPVLNLPLQKMNLKFNPNNLQPLGDLGTVYPNIRVSDNWGVLTVTNGALRNASWTNIAVSAVGISHQNENVIEGDGWKLELKEGWGLIAGERKGDYILKNVE